MGHKAEFDNGRLHCDYCNQGGHEATAHPEARADMAAWDRQSKAEEFPFGDHHEDY